MPSFLLFPTGILDGALRVLAEAVAVLHPLMSLDVSFLVVVPCAGTFVLQTHSITVHHMTAGSPGQTQPGFY